MALETADIAIDPSAHVVQFYDSEIELSQRVGGYLVDAARSGAVAIVIATEAHRRAFEAELRAAGIDPTAACQERRLIILDAAATMAAFMPGGRLDGDAFREVVGSVVRRAVQSGRPVRAYGEMVALLWDAGDVLAAIELEELWNDLGRELQFSLLCAYRSESVAAPEHAEALQQVCHLHSSVLHRCPPPTPALVGVEISAEFPAKRDAPRFARYFVADALASWGHSPALIADAQLLVTELATNAVIHAHSQFAVVARSQAPRVRLSVSDASPVRPAPRHAGPMAMSGRGLQIVAALSAAWGVDLTGDGKTVWAELRS